MILTLILLYLIFRIVDNKRLDCYLKAITCWTLCMYIMLELLSIGNLVTNVSLIICWGLLIIVLFVVFKVRTKNHSISKIVFRKTDIYEKVTTAVLVLVVLVTFVIALQTQQYNWDSLAYHLPRIVHWGQNQSVAHFATNSIRQIASPPLAEFVNLHVYLLTGNSDKLFNLLQWGTYITNAAIVAGIAKKLGCRRKFCMMTAFVYLTIPIAMGEAFTTQNDSFSAMWLLIFAYFILDLLHKDKKIEFESKTLITVVNLSLCITFSYLAKPSGFFSILMFLFWLLFVCIRRRDNLKILFKLLVSAAMTIILTALPELIRNFVTFHSYSHQAVGARQLIGRLNPKYVFMNFYKNFIFNTPNKYWEDLEDKLSVLAYKIANVLNVDINEASISEDGGKFVLNRIGEYGHDKALNPVVFFAFLFCVLLTIVLWKRLKKNRLQLAYGSIVLCSYVVFCAFLRWEPFVTRYMLGYLALMCPYIGWQLQALKDNERIPGIAWALSSILIFTCACEGRAMLQYHTDMSKYADYYYYCKDEKEQYVALCDEVKNRNLKTLGLETKSDFEYLIWMTLKGVVNDIEHINIDNESVIYEDVTFAPDGVWIVGDDDITEMEYHGNRYYVVARQENHTLLIKQGS